MIRSIILLYAILYHLTLFLPIGAQGQTARTDSLQQLLSQSVEDSSRVLLMSQVANEIYKSDKDSALVIIASATLLAEEIGFDTGQYELWFTKGKILIHYQNYDSGYVAMERARKVAHKIGDKRRIVNALLELVNAHLINDNRSQAFGYLSSSLRLATELDDPELLFKTLNRTGTIYSRFASHDSAEFYYKRALQLQESIGDRKNTSGVLMNLGNNAARANDLGKALEYYDQALELKVELQDTTGEALIYNMMGYSCYVLGDLPSSIKYYRSALDIYESQNNDGELVMLYIAMSNVYVSMDDYPVALSYIEEAAQRLEENDLEPYYLLFKKGEILLLKQDYVAALHTLNLSERIAQANQIEISAEHSYYIGSCYEHLGQPDSALNHLQAALGRASVENNHQRTAEILCSLGRIHFELGKVDLAIEELEGAIEEATSIGNMEYEMAANEVLYRIHKSRHEPAKALVYHERYRALQDSLFNAANIKQVARIEANHAFEQEKQRLELEQGQELEKQTLFRTILFISLSIAFVFIITILIFYRSKKKANEKLQQQNAIVELQKEKLEKMDEVKSRFFTNISHEFRTPITLILGPARRMLENLGANGDKETSKGLHVIERNGQRLGGLIDQILDLNKLEDGKLGAEMVQTDAVAVIQYLFNSLHSLGAIKGINMSSNSTIPELVMDLDKEMITKIVQNLVSNAVKFTKKGGSITLDISGNEKELEFSISDTGSGIPDNDLPHVFNRFYQSSDTLDDQVGTGVGLALTKELVRTLNGKIAVQSEIGSGTRFTVQLPITRNAPQTKIQIQVDKVHQAPLVHKEEIIEAKQEAFHDEDKMLILLVEDNKDMAEHVAASIGSECQIQFAENGQIGVEKAIEFVPDIIVSDVMMPEKDGFELTSELKSDERTSHIPIILLTARADVEDRISGLKRGADDYLSKPFNAEELQLRTKNLLSLRDRWIARYSNGGPSEPDDSPDVAMEDDFIIKVRESLFAKLDHNEYGANQIADDLGLSRVHLFRKLKALTGESPSNYVRNLRLIKAKEILQRPDVRVNEVARDVGFADPAYFTRSYKKLFGVSPKEHMK